MDYDSVYIQKQLIGRGHYGKVYLVYDRKTSKPYVAKKIQFQGMTEEERTSTLKEAQIHQNLKHNNILEFREYFLEKEILIMIMDYCEFGDLSVYIKNRKQEGQLFEQPLIVNLFVQMLFGLNYLHEHKILHRDIKTQNIFIDSQGTIKLADFGISKILDHTGHLSSTIIGTPYYLSPQACMSKGYSFKSDIWSLGCVLYELCTLQHPFNGDNILILAKKISSEQPKAISSQLSQQLAKIIKLLLMKNAEHRPSVKQIFKSKFISDYLSKFKMQDPIQQSLNYPIFDSQGALQNQFLDIQYSQGNVNKIINKQSRQKVNFQINQKDQKKICPQKSGADNFKSKCLNKMDPNLFYQIYNFMKSAKRRSMNDPQIQQQLRNKYTKKQFQLSMDIAQLLYLQQCEGL